MVSTTVRSRWHHILRYKFSEAERRLLLPKCNKMYCAISKAMELYMIKIKMYPSIFL